MHPIFYFKTFLTDNGLQITDMFTGKLFKDVSLPNDQIPLLMQKQVCEF